MFGRNAFEVCDALFSSHGHAWPTPGILMWVIYLIGGPPRVGKTLLAQRLATDLGLGWLPLDTIRWVLRTHLPPASGDKVPLSYIKDTIESSAYIAASYIIEGTDFMPRDVAELSSDTEIAPCFVGMSHVDPDAVTAHAPTPWHLDLPQEEQQRLMASIVTASIAIAAECEQTSIPYFDLADDYAGQSQRALQYLKSRAP